MANAITKQKPAGGAQARNVESSDDGLSKEQIFKVLSNQRRRWVLQYLQQHGDEPVSLRHMVDRVTALENDVPMDQIDSTNRKNVYTALKQTHLPKMDELGVIEYDAQRGRIALTDNADEAEEYLEFAPDQKTAWGKYYLGLSIVAAGLVMANVVGLAPLPGLGWPNLTVLLVGLFGLSSLVHTFRELEFSVRNYTSTRRR